jgi:hypothetical protein
VAQALRRLMYTRRSGDIKKIYKSQAARPIATSFRRKTDIPPAITGGDAGLNPAERSRVTGSGILPFAVLCLEDEFLVWILSSA